MQFTNFIARKYESRWLKHSSGLFNYTHGNNYDLIWPTTYEIENSARGLKAALASSKYKIEEVVVVTYSPHLEFGNVEYDESGFRGAGHRALEHFFDHIGTDYFSRVYIGIYQPEDRKYDSNAIMSHQFASNDYDDLFLANRFTEDEQYALDHFIIPNAIRSLEKRSNKGIMQYDYDTAIKLARKIRENEESERSYKENFKQQKPSKQQDDNLVLSQFTK